MGGFMEDVAKEAVVDEIIVSVFVLREFADILIEEAQRTAQVSGEGGG